MSNINVKVSNAIGFNVTVQSVAIIDPTTTKGDIIVNNGTTAVRFPAGSNGQTIVYDDTEPTGMKTVTAGAVSTIDNTLEFIKTGNGAGDNDNWRLTISGTKFNVEYREGGEWKFSGAFTRQ